MVQVLWCGRRSESSSARVALQLHRWCRKQRATQGIEIFVLIAIDRIKRARDPSIKLVDHDPVWIRMNI